MMSRRRGDNLGVKSVLLIVVVLSAGVVEATPNATVETHNATETPLVTVTKPATMRPTTTNMTTTRTTTTRTTTTRPTTSRTTTTETFETTTLGPWYTQPTPEPEICWDINWEFRPINQLPMIFVAENTSLSNCMTFCEQKYSCVLLTYSFMNQMCKIYDTPYTLADMSHDIHSITLTPKDCEYEFAVASETVDWSQAQTTCQGQRGNFASVLNDKDAQAIAEAFPLGLKEAWLGIKYIGGQWLWENGMAATEQRYFRDQPFNNVSSSSSVCGKAVIRFNRKNLHKVNIQQEDCSVKLPVICQFEEGVLPTDSPAPSTTVPLYINFSTVTAATTRLFRLKTWLTTPLPLPTLRVPVPAAKTSGPFSTDPKQITIGVSVSLSMIGVVLLIVVLDLATMAKDLRRMKNNLMGFYMECQYGDEENLDSTFEEDFNDVRAHEKDELHHYRLSIPQERNYDHVQSFQHV